MKVSLVTGSAVGATLGLALGVVGYTFIYAKGASYLTNDPKACANCHVMQDHFDAWLKSSHRSVAVCNDCHAPHNLIGKYVTKADNGFWHSFAFTTGRYPDHIRAKPRNTRVAERACLHCHAEIVEALVYPRPHTAENTSCIKCHRDVGHPKYP
jgi:cytochrome c nitrite reductase small subunit